MSIADLLTAALSTPSREPLQVDLVLYTYRAGVLEFAGSSPRPPPAPANMSARACSADSRMWRDLGSCVCALALTGSQHSGLPCARLRERQNATWASTCGLLGTDADCGLLRLRRVRCHAVQTLWYRGSAATINKVTMTSTWTVIYCQTKVCTELYHRTLPCLRTLRTAGRADPSAAGSQLAATVAAPQSASPRLQCETRPHN
mmetsp:Transcript_12504/g.31968  ORF Transcript_12504/g.31968 Transcript_12504/m.31968 type:complete len:203 (-) Transcript_12504:87-695(-)